MVYLCAYYLVVLLILIGGRWLSLGEDCLNKGWVEGDHDEVYSVFNLRNAEKGEEEHQFSRST